MKHPEVTIPELQEHGQDKYNWLPDFVYGGIDGAVTTFAVVAGVEGASLSVSVILILGFANLFADGFSMATGKYLSDKSEQEQYDNIRDMEFQHIKEYPEYETQEVREILEKYGFKGKQLECATKVIVSNPEGWVDLMMRNEFNMTQENINPLMGGISTFVSFVLIGIIPLIAYLIQPIFEFNSQQTFIATCIGTLTAMFIVGAVKSKFSSVNWFRSGLEVAALGGIAAVIAYGVGVLLRGLV